MKTREEIIDTKKAIEYQGIIMYTKRDVLDAMEEYVIQKTHADWQLCPKCSGQGIVSKPPYVAGDVYQWSSSSTSFTCNLCNGAKVIAPIILSEKLEQE